MTMDDNDQYNDDDHDEDNDDAGDDVVAVLDQLQIMTIV